MDRDLTSRRTISRYGVKLEELTSHGITLSRHDVLDASHTRRASPLLAGDRRDLSRLGQFPLPDKEFRSDLLLWDLSAKDRRMGVRPSPHVAVGLGPYLRLRL